MNTSEFLAHVLPREGVLFAVLRPAKKEYWLHKPCDDYEQLAHAVLVADSKLADAFFACASFEKPYIEHMGKDGKVKKKYRVQKNAHRVKSLWLDLDCGDGKEYDSQDSAQADVDRFCSESGLAMPTIVSSGRGLHCYWSFTSDIPADKWVKLASVWRSVVDHFGIKHDPACTTDVCRILRPVGAHNLKKKDNPLEVEVRNGLQPLLDVVAFTKQLVAIVKTQSVALTQVYKKPAGLNSDLAVPAGDYPPSDPEVVAAHCEQIRQFKESQGDVPEPVWYVSLGLIKHTINGEEKCHEWSKGHEHYNHSETDDKIAQWTYGPPLCAKFQQVNAEGCKGCPHKGVVKTPIQLGVVVVDTEPVKEVDTDTQQDENFPGFPKEMENRFAWDGTKLIAYDKDENGVRKAHKISDFLFYPKSFHSKIAAAGEKEAQSSWVVRIRKGVYKDFTISGACAGVGGRELFSSLGKTAIFCKTSVKKYMENYVTEWFSALRREQDEVKAYTTYGWHANDFLLGNDLYRESGNTVKVRIQGDAVKYETAFESVGSVETWVDGINDLYNREGHEQFQWMLGVGFGAPLIRLLGPGMCGCVISGYSSDTGFGKSTAGMLALGMYGDSQRLMLTKQQTTSRGVFAYCGVMNSLPILVDEITTAKAFELSEMVYTFSQGSGRVGAQSDGSLRTNVYGWATLMSSTSNNSIHGVLGAINGGSAPEIARVFECEFKRLKNQMTPIDAGRCIPALLANYGCVGRKYIAYVVTHQKQISEALVKMKELLTVRTGLKSDARFWIAGSAAILVGLTIAKKLGFHQFNLAALTTWAIAQLNQMGIELHNPENEIKNHFGTMLNELSANILVTNTLGDARSVSQRAIILHPPRGELCGRVVVEDQTLYLSISAMRAWCNKNRVDYRQMVNVLVDDSWAVQLKNPVALGSGTADYVTSPSRCLGINLKVAGGQLAAITPIAKLAVVA